LRRHATARTAGGRVYDGMIAACARKGKADEILTWSLRHFGGAQPSAVTPADR
jgi:hypothetical protein